MLFAYQYRDLTRHRFAQGGMARCAEGPRPLGLRLSRYELSCVP
jgi:hypothetical protein